MDANHTYGMRTCFHRFGALNWALGSYFVPIASRTITTRAEFHDKCEGEADEYAKDFVKKYDENLNIILIFVSGDLVRWVRPN